MMKVFIMGIDGASYELINNYIKDGKLPTFNKIINDGCFGRLLSTVPPHTAPGWVSAFTGVGPGSHGIYQFWDTQADNYVGKFMGRNEYNVLPVWDILNQYGIKTGVINVPMTHPPRELDGFILTWPLSNTLRYCYPSDLLINIAKNGGHYASDINSMCDGDPSYIDKAIDITRKRVKTIQYLAKSMDWDILFSVFTEVDRVSHFFWDTVIEHRGQNEQQALTNAVEIIYRETDSALKQILETLPEDTLVIILSDHGFCRGNIDFYVQSYLLDKKLLEIKKAEDAHPYKSNCVASDIVYSNWFECISNGEKFIVDWDNTCAYMAAPGSYGVNINLKGRQINGIIDKEDYEKVRERVIEELMLVKNPNSGERLFKKVAKREEVYSGEMVSHAPDIILVPYDYGSMVHHAIKPGTLFGQPDQKGMHREDGIIIMHGATINKDKFRNEAKLEDVAPTLLDFYQIEKPAYMEGNTVCMFNAHGKAAQEKITSRLDKGSSELIKADSYATNERNEIEDKLKSLGYL